MKMVKYKNGNYTVIRDLDSGTLVKVNDLDFLEADFPDSFDLKTTNCCNMGCKFCHENSVVDGKHGDILGAKFIDTLHPYTEIAIGGGNPLEHPDLIPFLKKLKSLKMIPNMTVNQVHFMKNQELIKYLIDNELIYGLGVSLVSANESFIAAISKYPNAVIHVINGVHEISELEKLYDKGLKLLILGYKEFRRGKDYYSPEVIKEKNELYNNLKDLVKHFKVVSFDNLALKQLDPKRILSSEEEYNRYYMGADGQSTMFVDLVKEEFSTSSTTPEDKRHRLLNNINDMFKVIRKENK